MSADRLVEAISRPESLAPHSVDAEEAVIGSVLINPVSLFEVNGFLQATDFFIVRNQWIWEAIIAIFERGESIDNLTVIEELRSQGRLESIGGSAYITYLINNTPTHIHAETYGRIVERAAIRRRLLAAASEIAQVALEENAEIADVCDHAESSLLNVTTRRIQSDLTPIRVLTSRFYDKVEHRYETKTVSTIPTGFTDLDTLIGGLGESELCVVAARPGVGKTSWMLSITATLASIHKRNVAFLSMEMSTDQLLARLYSQVTGLDSRRIIDGRLRDDHEWGLFAEASNRLGQWSLFIDDTPGLTLPQLRGKIRRLHQEHDLDLIVVDYLQLIHSGRWIENRVLEVGEVARGLKELALELRTPVLAAAQLSRAVEQRQDKRPGLSDLRESGEIENAADKVFFLYRDDVYDENTEHPNECEVIVGKNRNGPTGMISLYFRKEVTRFDNMTKHTFSVR